MRKAITRKHTPLDHDRQFHLVIAEMSGNSVMARLVGDLFDERHSPISAKISSRFEITRTWYAALKENEAILKAPPPAGAIDFSAQVVSAQRQT